MCQQNIGKCYSLPFVLQAASTKLLSAAPTDTGPNAHLGMSTAAVAEQAAAFNNADISSGYTAHIL